jgi:hypothetical protein
LDGIALIGNVLHFTYTEQMNMPFDKFMEFLERAEKLRDTLDSFE